MRVYQNSASDPPPPLHGTPRDREMYCTVSVYSLGPFREDFDRTMTDTNEAESETSFPGLYFFLVFCSVYG
jgi:hypothetical protein